MRRSVAFLQLWPNGWMDQDATCGRPRPRPHCVRWGPNAGPGPLPTLGPCLLWPNDRPPQQLLSSSIYFIAHDLQTNILTGWLTGDLYWILHEELVNFDLVTCIRASPNLTSSALCYTKLFVKFISYCSCGMHPAPFVIPGNYSSSHERSTRTA